MPNSIEYDFIRIISDKGRRTFSNDMIRLVSRFTKIILRKVVTVS